MCGAPPRVVRMDPALLDELCVALFAFLQLLLPLLAVLLTQASVVGGNEHRVVLACVRCGERVRPARRVQPVGCWSGDADSSLETDQALADCVPREWTATMCVWNLEAFLD